MVLDSREKNWPVCYGLNGCRVRSEDCDFVGGVETFLGESGARGRVTTGPLLAGLFPAIRATSVTPSTITL